MKRISRAFTLLMLAALLAACGYQPATPPPDVKSPVYQPAAPTPLVDPAAPARSALAARLNLPAGDVSLASMEAVDWPDGCLGIYEKDVTCTEAIVPGYRVVLEATGQRYEVHTDLDGDFYKVLPAQPSLEAPLLTWRSAQLPCQLAHFSRQGAALGSCTGSLMVTPYFQPGSAAELDLLAAALAPASGETPAGSLTFYGSGTAPAGPAEVRALAEWAALTAQELSGSPPANQGLLLNWQRSGGIAGFCDQMQVDRGGFVQVSSCAADPAPASSPLRLTEGELEQLYTWAEQYQTAAILQSDGAVADSLNLSLDFYGQGSQPIGAAEQPAFFNFCAELFARLAGN